MDKDKLIKEAKALYAYEVSGKYDDYDDGEVFDLVWCSLYDICRLQHDGITDDLDDEDYKETYTFLKENQQYTKDYKDKIFEF